MLSPNEILRDRYQIIRLLGQGGMGAVYEAMDSVFDSTVAVKEIVVDFSNAKNTKAQELVHAAFEREAKLLAKINHETFPHVKDYFAHDNRQFLVMELVDGEDLAKLLKDRQSPFPVSDVLGWADQLLDGLDYLHTQSPPIIHRDLKPQNLKLNSRGKIKLLDFGIAKGTDSTNATTVTDQTFIAATLNYSPIEQMLPVIDPTFLAVITHKYAKQVEPILEQNADTRSDIYALGATLYNFLTAASPVEAVKRGVDVWDGKPDPLPNPTSLNSLVSTDLSDWILKSMHIGREHRFSSATEMRTALRSINSGTSTQSAQKTEVMHFPPPITQPAADTPTEGEPNSVQTIAAPRGIVSTRQPQPVGITGDATANTAQPAKGTRISYKFLLLIPLFGLVFVVLGVAGVGAWWFLETRGEGILGGNSNAAMDTNMPTVADYSNSNSTPEVEPSFDVSLPDNTTAQSTPGGSETPRTKIENTSPNTAPTRPAKVSTPRTTTAKPTKKPSTPRRTPQPKITKRTPKPTPKKKNMNCIFTDDC